MTIDERRARNRAKAQRYRERHYLRTLEAQRRWRAKNDRTAYYHAYHAANAEKRRAQAKEWRRTHSANRVASNRKRRVAKLGRGGTHTVQQWLDKVALFGGCCAYCGRDDLPLTRDHKVPLIRGGGDSITNVVPACKPCNSAKGRSTTTEYLQRKAA